MSKLRVQNGIKFQYASDSMPIPEDYSKFTKIWDWCEANFGEFNQTWSTCYNKGNIAWNFSRREYLTHFMLTWY